MSHLNIIGWSWWRPCVQHRGMTTYGYVPSQFLYHIHYVNSYLCRHFLIDVYGIFTSLRRTISYLSNMFTYNLFISVSYSFISMVYVYCPFFSCLRAWFDSSSFCIRAGFYYFFVRANLNHISKKYSQASKNPLYRLVGSYCVIFWCFILLWVVLSFYLYDF